MRSCDCPKCEADISDSYEPADPSVGIMGGGWYCGDCDLAVEDDGNYEPFDDDVAIGPAPTHADGKIGTPISEISGRPGWEGFDLWCRVAKSWGYD